MMDNSHERGLKQSVDWWLVAVWVFLVLFGLLNIYAAVHSATSTDLLSRPGKQVIWIGTAVGLATLILFVIKPKIWEVIAMPSYAVVVLLLIAVIFIASDVKGSRSWIQFGPVSFQPAEISKITTSLALAALLSRSNFKFNTTRNILITLGLIGLPALAILGEKETGSMLVYVGYIFVLYREGMSGWILGFLGMAILLFILTLTTPRWVPFAVLGTLTAVYYIMARRRGARFSFLARRRLIIYTISVLAAGSMLILSTDFVFHNVLQDHQRKRIEVLLGLKDDPKGVGYNVNQSMIAIGSGGFGGKGFLGGTQTSFGFVPEQSTDFIFCTVGEEWGFIGCFIVIALYIFLIGRVIIDAEHSREAFTRIYGYCVASIFFMHLFINIGMTIGLMPVIGIPLPLLSYGGSSLWGFTILLFIFIALHRQEKKYF